ncbi:MAG: hypothetical protein ACK5MI_03120 [Mangrovibacterium sp.]
MNTPQNIDLFEQLVSEGQSTTKVAEQQTEVASVNDQSKSCTMTQYSPKSVAVFDNTQAIKDELKRMGGKFNARLTYQGEKTAGWIFHISRERQLAFYFGLN